MKKKYFFLLPCILVVLILSIKLCYDNTNLFHKNTDIDKNGDVLNQATLDKIELLRQISVENSILIVNDNMDNIVVDSMVDNGFIIIQLNVSALEQEKIDDIISYLSKSLNDFDGDDIIIKNDNQEILYP